MTPTIKPPVLPAEFTLDGTDTFEQQLIRIAQLHRERNSQYMTSPLEILPVEMWLSQIAIKGMRAYQAIHTGKIVDELNDNIVYSIMTLEQIEKQEWTRSVVSDFDNKEE
jgi:hypothetical protein